MDGWSVGNCAIDGGVEYPDAEGWSALTTCGTVACKELIIC